PDPWHKKRHHKRRLLQPPFVALLASRLKPGGYLHCATDWQEYAEQMLEVLGAEPTLENTVERRLRQHVLNHFHGVVLDDAHVRQRGGP
ncbi:tRNA (guanine(46)-N(7))-methyltransferase TrmB, partial [Klebsiella pneumoniae]|uniref:tRNA (guanine(46)-N(7))-methyltransferase TrmB n=1 Tax=Klebsiella pneumoniae TaxID=573 RepID=UPI003B5A1696